MGPFWQVVFKFRRTTLFGHDHRISRADNVLGSVAKARNRQNCGQVVGLQAGDVLTSIARQGVADKLVDGASACRVSEIVIHRSSFSFRFWL